MTLAARSPADRELSRQRQKLYRDRQRAGVIVLPLPLDQVVLADALVEAKFLHENDCDNRKKVVAALAHVIELWCQSMSVTRNDMGRDSLLGFAYGSDRGSTDEVSSRVDFDSTTRR